MKLVTLVALCALLVSSQAGAQDPDQGIEETIRVFESRLLLDLSQPTSRPSATLNPQEVVVYEGGAAHTPTSIVPLPNAGSWRTVVYVDAPMAYNHTIRRALLALGDFAIDMTALGTMEIVIADPQPRTAFAAESRSNIVESALARTAGLEIPAGEFNALRAAFRAKLKDGPVSAAERGQAMLAETQLVRRQADALQRFASSGGLGQPTILFLITDGYYLEPEILYFRDAEQPETLPGESVAEIAAEVAQTLAAYEWVVVTLPIRTGEAEDEVTVRRGSDYDEFVDTTGGIVLAPKAKDRKINLNLDSLEASVTPILQPLNLYVEQSAGANVRVDSQLKREVDGLQQRWWIYYRTTRSLDGEPRTASASLASTARGLRTATWLRSGTPEPVIDAKLRWLLSGQQIDFGRTPSITPGIEKRDGGVDVTVDWKQDPLFLETGWIRFSVAWREGERVLTEHVVVEGGLPNADGLWQYSVDLPSAAGPGALLALEALQFGDWGVHQL